MDGRSIAVKADNAREMGLGIVRERFCKDMNGRVKLFIVRDCLRQRDQELVKVRKPVCLADEIPSYCYREIKDGQPIREEPEPGSIDHGCDTMRYAAVYLDKTLYAPKGGKKKDKPGTYGAWLGHDKFWKRIERGEFLNK